MEKVKVTENTGMQMNCSPRKNCFWQRQFEGEWITRSWRNATGKKEIIRAEQLKMSAIAGLCTQIIEN